VDRAQKEEKMEQALTKLNETWSRVDFQFVQFKDTPVYTVRMADEDFEALEDNQVRVRAVMLCPCMRLCKRLPVCMQRMCVRARVHVDVHVPPSALL